MRTGQSAFVFILLGFMYRSMRLLGLDVDVSTRLSHPPSATNFFQSESRSRLVWYCYAVDTLAASGVAANSSWPHKPPEIPLPCNDRDFLARCPSRSEVCLKDLDQPKGLSQAVAQLDLPPTHQKTLIQLLQLVVPFIIFLNSTVLLSKLDDFSRCIPERFRVNELNMYVHKDQGIFAAVSFLHFMLHSTSCNLARISLSGFTFPLEDAFHDTPSYFRLQCLPLSHANATSVSNLIRQGFSHDLDAFDNPFCLTCSLESVKVQVIYPATVDNRVVSLENTRRNARTNLELMQLLGGAERGQSPYMTL
ncbi:hypothetical protein GCG54_00015359 [Colletotrichum gloeosporioides]|uniref:Transcription factor domain-containing protein n=1 Tax=Colletotrichum gloeosporioides TaxID=474922 RepID=A0A8H4FMV7_COLGL|nr:uncharacterized protein GCG54_00015359 [Colletotrichum gloeosporioides]KAF3807977.1 hypothetical protein GCG54_00015359 [Colletotrichum gloeosporioides]